GQTDPDATSIGHGASTHEQTVGAGVHSVGETPALGTGLADYRSTSACRDWDGQGNVIADGAGPGPLPVDVQEGADVICTITNVNLSFRPSLSIDDVAVTEGDPPGTTFATFTVTLSDPAEQ